MAEAPGGGEKTEQPTPKRLQEAREEGQISFSPEVNIAGLLLVSFSALAVMGPWFCQAMATLLRTTLSDALTWDLNDRETVRLLLAEHAPALAWLVPFLAVVFATGLILCIAQVGFQINLKPLIPKLSRISPVTGFNRLFGMRGLVKFLTNLAKLATILIIAYVVLSSAIPHMTYVKADLAQRIARESWTVYVLVMKLAAVLAIIAAVDFIYQRIQHIRDLMMTKQEVKEEMRQSEGDPHIKGKIRQIQRQMAQRRMMQEVPKADVIITNPTHVAVALKYDKLKMFAPIVVAKGYDEVAQRIKALAKQHNIVQVENVQLARALAKEVDIGKAIPTKWYVAVAEVLSMVYKLKKAG